MLRTKEPRERCSAPTAQKYALKCTDTIRNLRHVNCYRGSPWRLNNKEIKRAARAHSVFLTEDPEQADAIARAFEHTKMDITVADFSGSTSGAWLERLFFHGFDGQFHVVP